tara:strand:+ start:1775 stop:2239 length:465 start_codon:yes stop_codon:yes gene_type:complete
MAKIRKTASIENGIMQVLKILNEEEILKAIGKGSSYLRKCSNPDMQQQIDHNDSIKLDLACIKKGKAPPLFIAHEYIVINESDNLDSHKQNDIDEMLVKSTILHGKLTEVVKLAEDPKSDKGIEISKLEKKEIMEAIKNLEDKIMKIKITVDQK